MLHHCKICKKEVLERHVIKTRKGTMMYCTTCKIFMFEPVKDIDTVGFIPRDKLKNPKEGEPCFGCEFHYIHGANDRCDPHRGECLIEDMMEADNT